MEGVWQLTRSPDANSSKTFIHSHEHTHTHTHVHPHLHKYTNRVSFVSVVQSTEPAPTSRCPIISEPAPHEHCANSGTSSISHHSSPPKAGIQDEGWTAHAHSKRGRIGTLDEGRSAEHEALFKKQSTVVNPPPSPPPHPCPSLCLLPCMGECRLIVCECVCVMSGACADSWPKIISKSHRLKSVWNREALLKARLTVKPLTVSFLQAYQYKTNPDFPYCCYNNDTIIPW